METRTAKDSEPAKRGRKPIREEDRRNKRSIYVTDREWYVIQEMLAKKRGEEGER